MNVKKLSLFLCLALSLSTVFAQDAKNERRREKKQKVNAMIKQEEEGVLSYHNQTSVGLQLRTNGYGLFVEVGRMKTPRWTNLYMLELTEIKHSKEEKVSNTNGVFNSSFVYGKINNFYQAKLGFGKQYIFGQKGNKNGVAVLGIFEGGLNLGLLKPYYVDVADSATGRKQVKYESADSSLFLSDKIMGNSGFSKGWNELKVVPGLFLKAALRFDFNKYNERVEAVEIGVSVDFYSKKIPQMVYNKEQQLFFQGHVAFVFGGRK